MKINEKLVLYLNTTDTQTMVGILKSVAVLVAAILVGNWYLAENKKIRDRKAPWYTLYLTPPGLMVIVAVLIIPVIVWVIHR